MTYAPLTRAADGSIVLPGAFSRKYTADFANTATLPSWLTANVSANGTTPIVNAELQLVANNAAAAAATYAYVQSASITTAGIAAVRFTVLGTHIESTSRNQTFMGLSTWANITASTAGVGISPMLHAPANLPSLPHLRHTQGDWPLAGGSPLAMDNYWGKQSARVDRTLIYIPSTKMAYAVIGKDDVRVAREMTAVNMTTFNATWGIKFDVQGTMDVRCRGIELEVFYP